MKQICTCVDILVVTFPKHQYAYQYFAKTANCKGRLVCDMTKSWRYVIFSKLIQHIGNIVPLDVIKF